MTRAPLFVLVLIAAAGVDAAQPAGESPQLGRFFFTPAERAQLDMVRIHKKPPPPPIVPEATVDNAPQVVTYGGIVRRSDGGATLWINNRAVDAKEALSDANLKGRVRPDGAVSLQIPDRAGTIDVKVGQSIELQTGRVAESRKSAADKPPIDAKPPAQPSAPSESKAAPDQKTVPDKKAAAEASAPMPAR